MHNIYTIKEKHLFCPCDPCYYGEKIAPVFAGKKAPDSVIFNSKLRGFSYNITTKNMMITLTCHQISYSTLNPNLN